MPRAARGSRKNSGPPRSETDISEHVRHNYELRPYPPSGKAGRFRPVWRIVPIEWIHAMCPPAHREPRRILVAGCGTGNEAFALRKRFPKSEIVAVDFSPRSIKLARELQAKFCKGSEIKFRRADLTAREFRKTVRGKFDLISCHGVLSYIPNPGRALRNLADALAPSGAFYLGVNGARHFSEAWRPLLEKFGFDLNAFEDSRSLRDLLELCDTLADHRGFVIAKQPIEYLSSDLFGAKIANHSLDHWVALARRGGFHFRGSYEGQRTLRSVLNGELYDRLLPLSRAETHAIAERIAPSDFHRLVFSSTAPAAVPWDDQGQLLRCRVRLTKLYRLGSLRGKKARGAMRRVSLRSEATNTRADLTVPAWVASLLHARNNGRAVREILSGATERISSQSLRQQLYLLYLLGAISLDPAN